MQKLLTDIKNSKSSEELYNLIKDIPKVYHLIFRKDILKKFEQFGVNVYEKS